MTALVKLSLLVVSFSFLAIQTKCQNSEKAIQTNLGGFFFLLAQNNHVPQNQTFGFKFRGHKLFFGARQILSDTACHPHGI